MLNKNMKNRTFILILGILVLMLSIALVSAVYSRQRVAYTPTYVPFTGQPDFPLFDREMCGAGQDFILQVSPLGCTPSVVRSDLLEEQNVPVFCPITATQINPLIDVEAIDYISFSGQYPSEVQGISYLPARAALGRYRGQELVGQPVLDNIGYAVIVLKKQGNESAMPDFVEGNLTARLRYDIENAFGVGRASFYLPELSDADWKNNFRQYGFWEGRGYLRAENIDVDSATISVYSDRETYGLGTTGERRVLTSVNLQIGEESREVPLPGFNYCLGTMKIRLNGLEDPDTRVQLTVNGDVIEVKEGEEFLNNKCEVRDIDKQGITEKISVRCEEDSGRDTFNMIVSPELNLTIDDQTRSYSIGDKLYEIENGERSVYLVYAGTKTNSMEEKDLFVITAAVPGIAEKLDEDTLSSIAGFINRFPNFNPDNVFKAAIDLIKSYTTAGETVLRHIIQGQTFKRVNFGETKEIYEKNVKIGGFADAKNEELSDLPEDFRNYYEKAINDYDNIIESFSSETYPKTDERTLGEKALIGKIELTWTANQKRTTHELCNEFRDSYPNSVFPDICEDARKLASPENAVRDVIINGRVKRISFERVREPTFDELGATIFVESPDGETRPLTLRKNEIVYLSESEDGEEFIQLIDVDTDSVKLRVNLKRSTGEAIKQFIFESDTKTLKEDFPDSFGSQHVFTLQQVNLKKLARVSVIPKVNYADTEAEFPFKIGIEKRGIQLTPEQTREKIDSLNQTLEKWTEINENLGNVVSGFKAACLGVGTTLTVKNFFANLGGKGIARQKVMRGDNGWFEKCQVMVNEGRYSSVDSCLLDNNDAIESAVSQYENIMQNQNEELERLQEIYKIDDGFLGEDVIDTDSLREDFVDQNFKNELTSNLEGEINSVRVGNRDVPVSDIISVIGPSTVILTQARDLQLNSRLLDSEDETVKDIALAQIKSDLADIWVNNENEKERQSFSQEVGSEASTLISTEELKEISITNVEVWGNVKSQYTGGNIDDSSFVYFLKDRFDGQKYLLVLDDDYVIQQTYKINEEKVLTRVFGEGNETNRNPLKLSLKYFDRTTYQNKCENCKIRYYERAPYQGLPAVVPFDINDGWYAAVKSTLPIGGAIRAYDDSGRVSSFWLCNVGLNKREEFNSGIGDDICEQINLGTGQPYNQFPGLEAGEASRLVSRAVSAIEEASRRHSAGVSSVSIQGQTIPVGEPYVNIPDIQCQDFMSPSECNLLFNVCDPVVCPSSRCDLGGTYPVRDVVQSGIVGSLALCWPNFPEVKVPVCLSGVHAGIDSYLSVADSYQQCLQTSLETGQTVGICDEIYSIHMCEFFWRQSLPLANVAIPKVIGSVLGQDVRGGGEYLGVQDAWQRASDSVDFFTQYYAENSFQAFKARTSEGVGTEVCKNFVSLTTPEGGNILDALTTPDSPPQFYGRFDEIPFTTATNPPISHYKVFYHIYSGKDFPAYYQVYLRGSGSSFFQDTSLRRIVAQGFISAGEYATETRDFTAPSGYQEMCIVVNGQEECGFKQVTTEFGINYITEKYVADQASATDITSESACVSGTPSIFPLLNPNLQAGIEEGINPAIYNRGITRICATDNPGSATDPSAGTNQSRWVDVGHCGNPNIRCWLDTGSVKDTIRATDIESQVIDDVTGNYIETLKREGGYVQDFEALVKEIQEESVISRIEKIDESIDKVFYNHEKAYLMFLRAEAYKGLANLEIFELEIEPEEPSLTEGLIDVEPEELPEEGICSSRTECQKYLGEQIISRAELKKQEVFLETGREIDDAGVKADTGSESFECLVLQVAYTESRIRHCKNFTKVLETGNPLYCDGDEDEILSGDEFNSLGVMQINKAVHGEKLEFDENVDYAINLLVEGHVSSPREYVCNGKTYSGWTRALRRYNGWPQTDNIDCSLGNINYVEDVLSYKDEIEELFPNTCS